MNNGFTEYLRERALIDSQYAKRRFTVDPMVAFAIVAVVLLALCARQRPSTSFLTQATAASATAARTTARTADSRTVWITTYSMKYEGKHTKSGAPYRANLLTCAVPRSEWKALQGKRLSFHLGTRSVTCLVNDTCGPNVRNFDLSTRAWAELTGGKPGSRIKAQMKVAQRAAGAL